MAHDDINDVSQRLFDQVWGHLLTLLREEVDKSSIRKVAKRLDVYPTTVARWVNGERGERIELSHCLRIITALGGDLVSALQELGFEDFAKLLQMDAASLRMVRAVVEILRKGGRRRTSCAVKFLSCGRCRRSSVDPAVSDAVLGCRRSSRMAVRTAERKTGRVHR